MFGVIGREGLTWYYSYLVAFLPVLVACHFYGRYRCDRYPVVPMGSMWGAAVVMSCAMLVLFLSPVGTNPFIYFQV